MWLQQHDSIILECAPPEDHLLEDPGLQAGLLLEVEACSQSSTLTTFHSVHLQELSVLHGSPRICRHSRFKALSGTLSVSPSQLNSTPQMGYLNSRLVARQSGTMSTNSKHMAQKPTLSRPFGGLYSLVLWSKDTGATWLLQKEPLQIQARPTDHTLTKYTNME